MNDILHENAQRNAQLFTTFNPVTGEGSILERVLVTITDFPIKKQWLPKEMMKEPFVKQLAECGSIRKFYDTLNEDAVFSNNEAD